MSQRSVEDNLVVQYGNLMVSYKIIIRTIDSSSSHLSNLLISRIVQVVQATRAVLISLFADYTDTAYCRLLKQLIPHMRPIMTPIIKGRNCDKWYRWCLLFL